MRRERAAEAVALNRRWSHMLLETLSRVATAPQPEFAEHHLPMGNLFGISYSVCLKYYSC